MERSRVSCISLGRTSSLWLPTISVHVKMVLNRKCDYCSGNVFVGSMARIRHENIISQFFAVKKRSIDRIFSVKKDRNLAHWGPASMISQYTGTSVHKRRVRTAYSTHGTLYTTYSECSGRAREQAHDPELSWIGWIPLDRRQNRWRSTWYLHSFMQCSCSWLCGRSMHWKMCVRCVY